MATAYDMPVVCPILFGRTHELAILTSAIDAAQAGHGQVILISGEAGVGKSRLVAETEAYAVAHNVAVFKGHCYQEDVSAPYAPLIDLLQPFFARHAVASFPTNIEPVARELLHLLPDIAPVLADAPSVLTWEPEQKKRRLFTLYHNFSRSKLRVNHYCSSSRICTGAMTGAWNFSCTSLGAVLRSP